MRYESLSKVVSSRDGRSTKAVGESGAPTVTQPSSALKKMTIKNCMRLRQHFLRHAHLLVVCMMRPKHCLDLRNKRPKHCLCGTKVLKKARTVKLTNFIRFF
jgi:hypothetical protein